MRRRDVLAGGSFAAGAIALGSRRPLPAWTGADRIVLRQDIAHAADRLAALARVIGEMQRRSAADPADPKGWLAHADSHAAVCSAVANADPAQVHGSWWFLPWHRAYLAVTERKLQAIAGDPSLSLPYWNWSSDRAIPAAYREPGSPLAAAARHTPARPLRAVEVDHLAHDPALAALGVAALGARAFRAWTPEQLPASFGGLATPNPEGWHGRSRLETVPHNAIHNYVGGEAADGALGDMTELGTAARDPLFLAHHANLDRLWEAWRHAPARRLTEPDDPAFLDRQFVFPWLDGLPVTIAMRDVLDTRALGYAYDTLDPLRGDAPREAAAAGGDVTMLDVPPRRAGTRHVLRIAGAPPASRPLTIEIAVARPGEPRSAISVGAFATGRTHDPAASSNTELRFDVGAALDRLGARRIAVSVRSLPLGMPGPEAGAAPFRCDRMDLLLVS